MEHRADYRVYEYGVITKNSPRVVSFFASLDRMLAGLEEMAKAHKPSLNNERFLTHKEASEWLKVSIRTLQEWRYSGRISYVQLGNKILFRQSDILKIMEENLRK